jgi:23S rRNA-/tRNA-specific pseudouridylate synthase
LPEIGSRAAAERLLAGGGVVVDGEQSPKSRRLQGGEDVEFEPEPRARSAELVPEEVELRIAYEDEHLLVVDKPAGVVVHPSPGHRSGTLVHGVLAHGAAGGDEERPGIVHRLDRDTSGLLVVARSDEAFEKLKELVKAHGLERTYAALVRGRPRSRKGRIEAPIGRDRRDPTRQSLNTDSPREAVTHFELMELLGQHAAGEVPHRVDGDLREKVKSIDTKVCPLYLLTGEYDFSCTSEDTLRTAAQIPGVEVQIMKHVGHFPMSEHPAKFREYILPVLQKIQAPLPR